LMVRVTDPLIPRAVFGVLNTLLYFPSGAVYPQQGFPGWMRAIAVADPFTYSVHAFKSLLLRNTGIDAIAGDLLYLSIFTIVALTDEPRLQLLLIAFSFGAFVEGAAGFGTPVAVTGGLLIALGFSPLQASGLSLIANTAPVAFGALGTPIVALQGVTGLDLHHLSAMVGRQLPFFSLIVPFWVVWAYAGFYRMLNVWPAALTAGVAFAVPQFLVSNFHGPWLVDIVASMCSMAALVVLLKCWRPKDNWEGQPVSVP